LPAEYIQCRALNNGGVRHIVIDEKFVLITEPATPQQQQQHHHQQQQQQQQHHGHEGTSILVVITDMLPLQNVQSAVHGPVLLLKTGSLVFDTDQQCSHTKEQLDTAKARIRESKMAQLFELVDLRLEDVKRTTDIHLHSMRRSNSQEMKCPPSLDPREVEEENDRAREAARLEKLLREKDERDRTEARRSILGTVMTRSSSDRKMSSTTSTSAPSALVPQQQPPASESDATAAATAATAAATNENHDDVFSIQSPRNDRRSFGSLPLEKPKPNQAIDTNQDEPEGSEARAPDGGADVLPAAEQTATQDVAASSSVAVAAEQDERDPLSGIPISKAAQLANVRASV